MATTTTRAPPQSHRSKDCEVAEMQASPYQVKSSKRRNAISTVAKTKMAGSATPANRKAHRDLPSLPLVLLRSTTQVTMKVRKSLRCSRTAARSCTPSQKKRACSAIGTTPTCTTLKSFTDKGKTSGPVSAIDFTNASSENSREMVLGMVP